jgi:hypothetical protein
MAKQSVKIRETKEQLLKKIGLLEKEKKDLSRENNGNLININRLMNDVELATEKGQKSITLISLASIIISIGSLFLITYTEDLILAYALSITIFYGLGIYKLVKGLTDDDTIDFFLMLVVIAAIAGLTILTSWSLNHNIAYGISISIGFLLSFYCATKNKENYKILNGETFLYLFLIFIIPFVSLESPLRKYKTMLRTNHNKEIVKILEIESEPNYINIVLPYEYAKYENYLERNLSVNWSLIDINGIEDERFSKRWKENVIPYRIGNKRWYKLPIPLEELPEKVTLSFKDGWKKIEEELIIPLQSE